MSDPKPASITVSTEALESLLDRRDARIAELEEMLYELATATAHACGWWGEARECPDCEPAKVGCAYEHESDCGVKASTDWALQLVAAARKVRP